MCTADNLILSMLWGILLNVNYEIRILDSCTGVQAWLKLIGFLGVPGELYGTWMIQVQCLVFKKNLADAVLPRPWTLPE